MYTGQRFAPTSGNIDLCYQSSTYDHRRRSEKIIYQNLTSQRFLARNKFTLDVYILNPRNQGHPSQ